MALAGAHRDRTSAEPDLEGPEQPNLQDIDRVGAGGAAFRTAPLSQPFPTLSRPYFALCRIRTSCRDVAAVWQSRERGCARRRLRRKERVTLTRTNVPDHARPASARRARRRARAIRARPGPPAGALRAPIRRGAGRRAGGPRPGGQRQDRAAPLLDRGRGTQWRAAWVSVERDERDAQRFWLSVIDELSSVVDGGTWSTGEPFAERARRGGGRAAVVRARFAGGAAPVGDRRSARAELRPRARVARAVPGAAAGATAGVLATREDPRVGLHRLRLAGD